MECSERGKNDGLQESIERLEEVPFPSRFTQSENELQRQLQLTHVGTRPRNLTELVAGDVRVRIPPVGMVRKIERFEAELQPRLL